MKPLVPLCLMGISLTISACKETTVRSPFALKDLEAKRIVVVSDGDAFAQTYLGAPLTPFGDGGFRDQLTQFYREGPGFGRTATEVSNSVNGTPEVFELSSQGDWGVAVETRAQRLEGQVVLSDLQPGKKLSFVSFGDQATPTITRTVDLPLVPLGVAIDSNDHVVAVAGIKEGRGAISLVSKKGDPKTILVEDLLGEQDLDQVSLVQWHPSSPILAVHLFRQGRIAFFRFDLETFDLVSLGAPVRTKPDPFVGRFVAEGDFYVTANWGRNFEAESIFDRLPQDESSLSLIKLDLEDGNHLVTQEIETALSPEGIAVSKDGSFVATVSMKNSLYAVERPEFNTKSELRVFSVERDADNVRLQEHSRTEFEGILPEGGSFDVSGKFFLASVFQNSSKGSTSGVLKVFSLPKSKAGEIEEVADVPVAHGAHHVVVR